MIVIFYCFLMVGNSKGNNCSDLKSNRFAFMSCRCIKTFEVEFSSDHKEFSRINHQDTIFTSYVYSPGKV